MSTMDMNTKHVNTKNVNTKNVNTKNVNRMNRMSMNKISAMNVNKTKMNTVNTSRQRQDRGTPQHSATNSSTRESAKSGTGIPKHKREEDKAAAQSTSK